MRGKDEDSKIAMFDVIKTMTPMITFSGEYFRPIIGNKLSDDKTSVLMNSFKGFKYGHLDKADYSVLGNKDDPCSVFGFVHQILSNGNADIEEANYNWLRGLFQTPDQQRKVALFPISKEGAGKNLWFSEFIGKLCVGPMYTLANAVVKQLCDKFNAPIIGKVYCILNEAEIRLEHMDKMKTYITDSPIQVQKKGQDEISIVNYLNVVLLSNNADAFEKLNKTQRRFMIWSMSDEYAGQTHSNFWDKFSNYLLRPIVADTFVHWLLNTPITKDIRDFPKSELLDDIVNAPCPADEYLENHFHVDFPKGGKASEVIIKINDFITKHKGRPFKNVASLSAHVVGYGNGKVFTKVKNSVTCYRKL